MPLPETYATATDLAAYWRPLSEAEQARATVLLGFAATLINERPGAAEFSPGTCKHVSLDMVKRAMLKGDGVLSDTESQSMADMTAANTRRYLNPAGNLYLTDQEADRLARQFGGGAAMSLTLSSNVRVPGEPWNNQPAAQSDAST